MPNPRLSKKKRRLHLLKAYGVIDGTGMRRLRNGSAAPNWFNPHPPIISARASTHALRSRLADKVRGLAGPDDQRDSRAVRALLKAFPNRVTLHAPHGEPAASEWRAALERDVATLRERTNRRALASLMARCAVECADMEAVVIR